MLRIYTLAFIGVLLTCTTVLARDHVILFAPGDYQHLKPAPFHAAGASSVEDLLRKSSPNAEITTLTGSSATSERFLDAVDQVSSRVDENDAFMVFVFSAALEINDQHFITTYATPKDVASVAGTPSAEKQLVPVQKLLQLFSLSRSTRCLLVMDSATATPDGPLTDANLRVGRRGEAVKDGQWVIISRGRRLLTRNKTTLTSFAWSLLDGIHFHADANRDQAVTSLELSNYMKLFAEDQNEPSPRFSGKTSDRSDLFVTVDRNDPSLPTNALNENSRALYEAAQQQLAIYLDGSLAMAQLDRANRLAHEDQLVSDIQANLVTAQILNGDIDKVFTAPDRDEWWIVLPKTTMVKHHNRPSSSLPGGTIIRATKYVDGFVNSAEAYRVGLHGSQLRFERITDQSPGWVWAAHLKSDSKSVLSGPWREKLMEQSNN